MDDTMTSYTLTDFNKIQTDGFHYIMKPSALELVNSLAETVGAVSYSRTPVFPKKDRKGIERRKQSNNANCVIKDEDWNIMRNFKKTEMAVKEGNEKRISEIRGLLNKLSIDNYSTMKELINQKIEECEEDINNFEPVIQAIFDIATTNKFYSNIYATLYKDLQERWTDFSVLLNEKLEGYSILFKDIESVDPGKDYDGFCRVVKNNDLRRSLSTFLAHLVNKEVVLVEVLVDTINTLQLKVEELIYLDESTIIVEELVENISILVITGKNKLVEDKCWSGLTSTFTTMTKINPKETPSFSNKSLFKYMDIKDYT